MDHCQHLYFLPDLVPLDATVMVHYVLECNCLIVDSISATVKNLCRECCAVLCTMICASV